MSFNGRRRTLHPPSLLYVKTLRKLSGGRLFSDDLTVVIMICPLPNKACLTARMLLCSDNASKKGETQPTLKLKGASTTQLNK